MSTDLGTTLPAALLARLGAHATGPDRPAVPICTVDGDGFPHPAMLSGDDIAVSAPGALRIALYSGTRTAAHLAADGRVTLLFVDEQGVHYVKARAAAGPRPDPSRPGISVAELRIAHVLADAPDPAREGSTAIVSGIRFRRSGEPRA
jgi:hypothetical protein